MSSATDGFVLGRVIGRAIDRLREFTEDQPAEAQVTSLLMTGSLLAAFAGFLLVSPLTVVAFVVFLATAAYGWVRYQGLTARLLAFATTVITILILLLITVFIAVESVPVVMFMTDTVLGVEIPGLGLFTTGNWDAVSPPINYSMVPMIHGTVLVTLVATAVAAPLGVAAALVLSEIAPATVREIV